MRILKDLDRFHPDGPPLFLGLGNFDGVHLGHQALLKEVVRQARGKKGLAAVFTFPEHPQAILHPETQPKLLNSPEQKLFLLSELGLDLCFLIPFTSGFSKIEAVSFVGEILVKRLKVRKVFLGYNARFGHDRKGDTPSMGEWARRFGFEFQEMEPVKVAGDFVSSGRIRKLIEAGNLGEAEQCLGRPFSRLGQVVKGSGRGTELGYPTANLEWQTEILIPEGVYPVFLREVKIQWKKETFDAETGPWRKAALNLGRRPTFEEKRAALVAEAFILDYKGDLYGKTVEVAFYPRLRSEQKFSDLETLKRQIRRDVGQVRQYLDKKGGSNPRKKIFTRNGG